ncbi:MAG: PPC domain-containing protein [Desulfobacterales bacterium]|nr:PPC domain-containing protein [Desulfobacterales bacterium]
MQESKTQINWLKLKPSIFFTCILTMITLVFFLTTQVHAEDPVITQLNPNESLNGMVGVEAINYYKITVPEGTTFLNIKLTGVTGDPDLYLLSLPTSEGITLSSSTESSDSNELILYCKPQAGELYIGVLGYSDGAFTITANIIQHQDVIPISDHISVQNNVGQGRFVFYKYTIANDNNTLMHIGLIPVSGNPDMIIFYNEGNSITNSLNPDLTPDWLLQTDPQQGEWYIAIFGSVDSAYSLSARLFSSEQIMQIAVNEVNQHSISAGEYKLYQYRVPEDSGSFNIELNVISGNAVMIGITEDTSYYPTQEGNIIVYGYQDSTYSITAKNTTIQINPLQLNVGISDSIAENETKFYKISLPEGVNTFEVELTEVTGDPELYTQYSSFPILAINNYTCSSTNSEYTPELCLHPNPETGEWYIAVYGYYDSTYKLTAKPLTVEQILPLTVNAGMDQSISAGEYKIYKYQVPADSASFDIELNVTSGNAVIQKRIVGSNYFDYMPQDYYSPSEEGLVTVYGYEASTYVITAKNDSIQINSLEMNLAAPDSVMSNETKFYKVIVPEGVISFDVELTDVVGDPELFTRYLSAPIQNNGEYDCSSTFVADTGELCSHYYPQTGEWIIAVYGYADATYTLTAKTSGTVEMIPLTLNESFQKSISAGEFHYYKIPVSAGDGLSILKVELTNVTGDPDLFSQFSKMPNLDTGEYQCSSTSSENLPEVCTHIFTESGDWYVIISGYSDAIYTITATTSGFADDIIPLQENIALPQTITAFETKYYKITVPEGMPNLRIELTDISGDPDLFSQFALPPVIPSVALNEDGVYQYQGDGNYILSSMNPDNAPEVCLHPMPESGDWYLGVYGYLDASYTITCNFSEIIAIPLDENVSLTDSIIINDIKLYQITVPPGKTLLNVRLTNVTGDPDLFLSQDGIYDFSGNGSLQGLDTAELCSIPYPLEGILFAKVLGCTNASYTIQYDFNDLITQNVMPIASPSDIPTTDQFFAAGKIISGGDSVQLEANFPDLAKLVTIYLAIDIPSMGIFFIDSTNNLTMDMVPWKQDVIGTQQETILPEVTIYDDSGNLIIPHGEYGFYSLIVPSGEDLFTTDWSNDIYDFRYFKVTL